MRREVARRRGRRYTQDDLAREVGVAKGSVAKWETDMQTPTGENLVRLARALGTTPAAILGQAEEESAEDAVYSDGGDQLAMVLQEMEKVARFMTRMGPPGDGLLAKRAYLAGIKEIIIAAGMPLPQYWYELSEKVESGAI